MLEIKNSPNSWFNKVMLMSIVCGSIASVITNQILYGIVPLSAFSIEKLKRRKSEEAEKSLIISQNIELNQIIKEEFNYLGGKIEKMVKTVDDLEANQNLLYQHLEEKDQIINDQKEWENCLIKDNEELSRNNIEIESRNLELELKLEQLQKRYKQLSEYLVSESFVADNKQLKTNLVDLSKIKLAIVGGYPELRREIIDYLEQTHNLNDYQLIPRISEKNTNQRQLKQQLKNTDFIFLTTSFISHSMSNMITDLEKRDALTGKVVLINGKGKSSLIREIETELKTQEI